MSLGTEQTDGFNETLKASLERLQAALRTALISSDVPKPTPVTISRSLGLDKSIAWKIGRIANAKQPLEALEFLPGMKGARIVVDACVTAGCSKDAHQELGSAFEDLALDIRRHAGNRDTARVMAKAALAESEQTAFSEPLLRDQFASASAIWGAQARIQIKTDIIGPSDRPGSLHTAGFEGFVDFSRLRPGGKWQIARKRMLNQHGVPKAAFEALDPEFQKEGAPPLFSKFCSHPLPGLTLNETEEGFLDCELDSGRVGRTESVTCLLATMFRDVYQLSPPGVPNGLTAGAQVRTPCELLIIDLYVHKSLVPTDQPTAAVYSQIKMGAIFPATGLDQQLPVNAEVEHLSMRAGAQALFEMPQYGEALQEAFTLAGTAFGKENWELKDYVGYRVRLTYPPLPSFGGIRIELPFLE